MDIAYRRRKNAACKPHNKTTMNKTGEIVLYQTEDNQQTIDVKVENETVWLSLNQLSVLFERDKSVISRHIRNIFTERELEGDSVVAKFATTATDGKIYAVDYYNLDVIISVGYRVKSKRGTQFRQWANRMLKDYFLKGYAINQRVEHLERRVSETEQKIDFFIKTSLPPVEGIFYDGQIFDAWTFAAGLIKSARTSVTLIDNYIDESVLLLLSKRSQGVNATVYTAQVSAQLQQDLQRHNAQYPPITVQPFNRSHDRFLLIDTDAYHIGASLKDLGKKWFAFAKMNIPANVLLQQI
jgi:hypothetical protein